MSSASDKRDTQRIPILGDLQGEIMVLEPLQVKDLGPGGASIETTFPLALDSLHELRLNLSGTSVVVKGRVVHARISDVHQEIVTYWSGIEFVEPSNHVRTVIADFLQSVQASRSGV
jgi:hypothetical protein